MNFLPANIENLGVAALSLVLTYMLALRAGTFAGAIFRDFISKQTDALERIATRQEVASADLGHIRAMLEGIEDTVKEGRCRSTQS